MNEKYAVWTMDLRVEFLRRNSGIANRMVAVNMTKMAADTLVEVLKDRYADPFAMVHPMNENPEIYRP